MFGSRRSRISGLFATAGVALLIVNSLWHLGDRNLGGMRWSLRYWEDVGASIRLYLGAPSVEAGFSRDEDARTVRRNALRDRMVGRVERAGIAPPEFWRTLPSASFLRDRDSLPEARANQDVGRHRLYALGYRILGGISPFLPTWLGLLAFIPVLVWTLYELRNVGLLWTAGVLALVTGASIFVVEILALPHSGIAFYWIALFSLTGFAAYCCLGEIHLLGLAWRVIAYGSLWALCIWVRHGTLLVGGGFAVALLIGLLRLPTPLRRARRALLLIALGLVFCGPSLLARDPIPRPAWFSMWEGLGDFDRKYGHTWLDPEAVRVARAAGVDTGPDQIGYSSPAAERFFRSVVVQHVTQDPLWYATILAKRTAASVSLWWLWPRFDGNHVARVSTSPQQGMQDSYFGMAWPIDYLVVGPGALEIPTFLIVAPTMLLVFWGIRQRASRARAVLPVLACVALGALAAPVLVTTASGMEPQMFGLVHFLALGMLADAWNVRDVIHAAPPRYGSSPPR